MDSVHNPLSAGAVPDDPAAWAAIIAAAWHGARDQIFAVGRQLLLAKEALPHGAFIAMVKADLPFGRMTANRLMAIAEDPRLSNVTPVRHLTPDRLPPAYSTLYELTRLDDATFARAAADGLIAPDMKRTDVKRLQKEAKRRGLAAEHAERAAFGERRSPGGEGFRGGLAEGLRGLAASGRRFGKVLADPAWFFETWSDKGQDRSPEYDRMSVADICALPVRAVLEDDAVLFLWVCDWLVTPCDVAPRNFAFAFDGPVMVPAAALVMKAWGFDLVTRGFCWAKQNPSGEGWHLGQGAWTRANPEDCWIGTRGKPSPVAGDVRSLVVAPLDAHSAKPPRVHDDIERIAGGDCLELFARRRRPGWYCIGNQLEN